MSKWLRYIGASDVQVNYGRGDDPRSVLSGGELYEVAGENVYDWYTHIELVEFPGMLFSSVHFESEVPDGKS